MLLEYIEQEAVPYMQHELEQGHILEAFVKTWENYAMIAKMMHRLFVYLDKFFLKGKKLIGPIALDIFYAHMSQSVKDSLRAALMEEFTRDRNGNVVDRQLIEKVIKTYV